MAAVSARVRAEDGCPWDRRQTHASLRPFVLEEAYETVDAIEHGAPADLAEELGDLFLQIILHAQLAAEAGSFDLTDVYRTLGAKIVRRHPHVFGDVEVADAAEVLRNWETIKAGERERSGAAPSPFAGIARALPALPASREIQERASSLGWDWPAIEGVWDKVAEELAELHQAAAAGDEARDERLHELGDVLFAVVNLARWLKLDPEEALRAANRRWIERYERVERLAADRGQVLAELSADEKDALWNEGKVTPACAAWRSWSLPSTPATPASAARRTSCWPRGTRSISSVCANPMSRHMRAMAACGFIGSRSTACSAASPAIWPSTSPSPPWPPCDSRPSTGSGVMAWSRWRRCRTSSPSRQHPSGSPACRCCWTCTRTCRSSSATASRTRCCVRCCRR
jgi:MazG family protein